MAKADYLFTSESVSEGHPDKVCDRISDTIVDAYLAADPGARVAAETLARWAGAWDGTDPCPGQPAWHRLRLRQSPHFS